VSYGVKHQSSFFSVSALCCVVFASQVSLKVERGPWKFWFDNCVNPVIKPQLTKWPDIETVKKTPLLAVYLQDTSRRVLMGRTIYRLHCRTRLFWRSFHICWSSIFAASHKFAGDLTRLPMIPKFGTSIDFSLHLQFLNETSYIVFFLNMRMVCSSLVRRPQSTLLWW